MRMEATKIARPAATRAKAGLRNETGQAMLNSALGATLPRIGCRSIDPLTLFIVFFVFVQV